MPNSVLHDSSSPASKRLILLFFFLSGMSSLIYEVIWVRQLTLIFGATVLAVSTVLCSFMAGLALGSYLFGRWVDRTTYSPLKIYLALEIGIGFFALLLPYAFGMMQFLYPSLTSFFGASFWLFSFIRFLIMFCLLLLPTILMGGTLPVISRLFVQTEDRLGKDMGSVYGWNTLGAMLGCFIAGFWLIRNLGMTNTNYLAVAINLFVVIGMSITLKDSLNLRGAPSLVPAQKKGWQLLSSEKSFVLLAICLSGFTALGYEVVWTRLLTLVIGSSAYAFSIMLSVFLGGIALGSLVGGRWADKSKNPLMDLAILEILIGLFGIIVVAGFGYLPALVFKTYMNFSRGWDTVILVSMGTAAILMLFPTFCFGMTFPYAVKLYFKDADELGEDIGIVYSVNTVGSIFGSLAVGFLGIPLLGTQLTSNMNSSLNLLVGIGLLLMIGPVFQNKQRAALLGLAIIILPAQFLLPNWNKKALISGVMFSAKLDFVDNIFSPSIKNEKTNQVLFFEEDITATVSVLGLEEQHRSLQINGKTVASTSYKDMRLQQMLGHLPLLLAPDPKEVLVIGLGTGVTTGATTLYPVDQVTVVELSASVPRATRYFGEENYHVVENPQVNIVIDDGRNYLLSNKEKYDVITSDPIHPWVAGASSLYSQEHYQLCLASLNDEGVMCQWVPLYQLSNHDYLMILKTFAKVFPHSSLWITGYDTFLIGSKRPLSIDYKSWAKKLANPAVKQDLEKINLSDMYELLSCYVTNQSGIDLLTSNALVNSDNFPYLEFDAPKSMYTNTIHKNIEKFFSVRLSLLADMKNFSKENLARYQQHFKAKFFDLKAEYYFARKDKSQEIASYEKVIEITPDSHTARKALIGYFSEQANYFYHQKNYSNAIKYFNKLIKVDTKNAKSHFSLGVAYFSRQQADKGIDSFLEAIKLEPDYSEAIYNLAIAYEKSGQKEMAAAEWRNLLSKPRTDLSNKHIEYAKAALSKHVSK